LLKVYPLGGNKLIYIIYSDYHIRICIYDYLLHKILNRYEYIGKENSIDKFYLEPHEKYFIYNGKQIDISEIYPTVSEKELIEDLGERLTDLYISSDRKYAYVVVKSEEEQSFGCIDSICMNWV